MLPANQHFVAITIPNGVSYEVFQTAAHPARDLKDETLCKEFARRWYDGKRSAVLIVPSISARLERNFLINPRHPDAAAISHALPEPVWWDERLYLDLSKLFRPLPRRRIVDGLTANRSVGLQSAMKGKRA